MCPVFLHTLQYLSGLLGSLVLLLLELGAEFLLNLFSLLLFFILNSGVDLLPDVEGPVAPLGTTVCLMLGAELQSLAL